MDAKSLLRAKKAEAKINHPYAAYSTAGQLRCSICAVPVKQWDAHLLTKQHRSSVAREKASQVKPKRPAESVPVSESSSSSTKRARVEAPPVPDDEEGEEDDYEGSGSGSGAAALPAGFFSAAAASSSTNGQSAPPASAQPTGDDELDIFLASLAEPEDEASDPLPTTSAASASTSKAAGKSRNTYKEIAPGQASYEAAPVRIPAPGEEEVAGGQEEEPTETDAQRKERLEKEEREEIMGRLEEEERAQEDADTRVILLKQRMEMLKKRRAEAKASGKPAKNGGGR